VIKAHVLVEGQTEETFIRTVLGPYLAVRGIYLTPVLVATKRIKFGKDFGTHRLLPYLSLHEFEALLLADPGEIGTSLSGQTSRLEEEVSGFRSPEEIDEGPETHPAARIVRLLPSYRKAVHGPLAAARIGLKSMRQRCPHFDNWVTRLERLSSPTP